MMEILTQARIIWRPEISGLLCELKLSSRVDRSSRQMAEKKSAGISRNHRGQHNPNGGGHACSQGSVSGVTLR